MHKPVGSAHEQQVSALRTAKNRLEYLTPNDWSLILDKSKPQTFKKGERLVEQGKQTRALYLLGSGKVNISVAGVRIAQIGPGEVCGDMAFLENSVPSATAVADEDVEAYTLEWSSLESLFELFPHLASRFYRSLAVNLSRRLRDQIGAQRSVKQTAVPQREPSGK
ncbi:MAG: cyclic nucleotide-binding domain-containing protein [Acidobacteriia bacterium]|nr:cyclic nucleotide-binding domain-containing protein [Terriglobia bacterium]